MKYIDQNNKKTRRSAMVIINVYYAFRMKEQHHPRSYEILG